MFKGVTMVITKDKVVTIDYTLKDDAGALIDSSKKKGLSYIHGKGTLIPALEKQLEGKQPGDSFELTLEPADAYGEYDDSLVFNVSREKFNQIDELKVGMKLKANTNQGERVITITDINDDKIQIDMNHKLAGKKLHFDIKVADVRDADKKELEA
jgi:FKBP-type peptidyl-prolyl cis-trans isomerase SlyD